MSKDTNAVLSTAHLIPDLPTGEDWVYARFSDAEKQDGRSIEQQVLANREAASKLGLRMEDDCVFADAGIPGWVENRPALSHLLHLIRTGKAKCKRLFIFNLARLARDPELAHKWKKFFAHHRVTVYFVADGMVSGTENFDLIHGVKAVVAQDFLRTLSKNVKRAHANQFEKEYYAHAKTYGYDHEDDLNPAKADSFDKKKSRFGVKPVINQVQAEIIRLIFTMYRLGHGYNGIARHLNRMGVKSPRRPTKHSNRQWGTSSVRSILSNERYTGFVTFGVIETSKDPETGKLTHTRRPESEWRTAQVEELRIISDDDFKEIQRIRASKDPKQKKRKPGEFTPEERRAAGFNKANGIYPLSGLLFCEECLGPMNILQGGTYLCLTAFRGGNCQNRLKLIREGFQTQMLERMAGMLREARSFDNLLNDLMVEIERQSTEAIRAAAKSEANRESAQSQLNEVCRQLANIAVAMGRNPNSKALDAHLRELEAEQKILEAELTKADVSSTKPIDRDEVAEFLTKKLEHLHDVLTGDLHGCREQLRKRIGKLFLKATTFENAPAFEIRGDLQLFTDAEEKCCAEGDPLQHSILRPRLNLSGLIVKLDEKGHVLKVAQQPMEGPTSGELMLAA